MRCCCLTAAGCWWMAWTRAISSCHAQIHSQVGLVFQRPQNQIVATTCRRRRRFRPRQPGPGFRSYPRARGHGPAPDRIIPNPANAPRTLLSAGETQRLALGRRFGHAGRAALFSMKPLPCWTPLGRAMVLEQIRELNRQGITVLLITHLMEEAALGRAHPAAARRAIGAGRHTQKIYSRAAMRWSHTAWGCRPRAKPRRHCESYSTSWRPTYSPTATCFKVFRVIAGL